METIKRQIRQVGVQMRNILARGVVSLVSESFKMRGLQLTVLDGEVLDSVEHAEPYGFSSACQPGAEAFVGFIGADRSHPVALIVADRRYRPTDLESGESCQYTRLGQRVWQSSEGTIIDGAGLPVFITNTPKIILDSDVEITKGLKVSRNVEAGWDIIDQTGTGAGRTMGAMRNTYNGHDHNDSIGGKTTAPNQKTSD